MMPEMDGFEFSRTCATTRSGERYRCWWPRLSFEGDLVRLNGQVVQVIRKIGQSPDALLRDLGRALASCVARDAEAAATGTEG